MITFALLTALLGSPLASIPMLATPAVLATPATAQEPIELEIDPTTRMPVGPAVAPRGPLLDPRDLPEAVREHLDVATGLEGFDLSLTALFVRYLAFVVEREGLDPIYHPHAEALRDDWNEHLGGLLASLDPEAPGEPVHAVVYHDTGRRLFRSEPMRLRVERAPRLRFVPVGSELFAELALQERYIAGLGPDMARDEATHLKEAAQRVEVDPNKDPWFLHATTQLLFLSMGAYRRELVADNPFELTEEQFLDRCRLSLRQNMVVARLPSLPEDVAADGTYFLEGWVVARQVEGDGDEAWEAPEDLLALDRATQRPLLFVQVPAPEGSGGPDRVRIDMLAGGEQRLLYEGAWPLE